MLVTTALPLHYVARKISTDLKRSGTYRLKAIVASADYECHAELKECGNLIKARSNTCGRKQIKNVIPTEQSIGCLEHEDKIARYVLFAFMWQFLCPFHRFASNIKSVNRLPVYSSHHIRPYVVDAKRSNPAICSQSNSFIILVSVTQSHIQRKECVAEKRLRQGARLKLD